MRYTVLSVAYPLVPVSSDTAGGAEQIVWLLDRQIVSAGGRSLVMAAKGSRVSGEWIPTPAWDGAINSEVRAWAAREHRRILNQNLRGVDIVHFHGLDFHSYLPDGNVPCLATLHLPLDWYPAGIFSDSRIVLNCVSTSQRTGCPAPARTIHHGVEVSSFGAPYRKKNYALSLGRVCPEKGFHFAIGAARRARVPLLIAGRVFPYQAHERYFQREIAPRLGACVRFAGPAGSRKKRRLLSEAKCLLIPSTVAETSSLVAMESIASGTPVIAFRSGALPEIVEHGRTGFIVAGEAEMAEAIGCVDQLSPDECRCRARDRFSAGRMAREYFEFYREMKAGEVIENCTSVPVV